jgi:colanic acid/amylovoran biosynthesis glycosyltransferase
LESLLALLERTGANLLHIYFGHIAVHLLPLIRAWPRPVIVSFHGADVLVELDKPAYRRASQEMLRHVRQVFVRSESLGRAVAELDCEKEKIKLVRTGIPLERFPLRLRAVPDRGRWQLLQAGRLIEKKGVATSLRAFARFSESFPEATMVVTGDGPLLDELEDLADSLHIHNRVSFPGFVSQDRLRDLFYASHIFLHPSQIGRDGNQEGVPNSMLEAMATGLPVFATNHGGIPEAIENGVSGVLVAERDHEALANALLSAAKNPWVLSRFARGGAEAVAQKFDQSAQIERLENLYLETIRRG